MNWTPLDTASMEQGDIRRVQVRGRAFEGEISGRIHGRGGSEPGAQEWPSRPNWEGRLGRQAAFGRQRSRGGNGLSQGLQSPFPVGWKGRPRNTEEREGVAWEGFVGEGPACWEVGPGKEQP